VLSLDKRSVHIAKVTKQMHQLVQKEDLDKFKALFTGKSKRNLHLIDVNCPNSRGDSILHEAAKRGNLDLVQACLNLGADPFQKNRKGKIPVELSKKEAVRNVLKSGSLSNSSLKCS
jgi:ankyrin repeat protein